MKHPGPWNTNRLPRDRIDETPIRDANGEFVAYVSAQSDEAICLMSFAPELLSAIKYVLDHPPGTHYGSMGAENARALIERIEKGTP